MVARLELKRWPHFAQRRSFPLIAAALERRNYVVVGFDELRVCRGRGRSGGRTGRSALVEACAARRFANSRSPWASPARATSASSPSRRRPAWSHDSARSSVGPDPEHEPGDRALVEGHIIPNVEVETGRARRMADSDDHLDSPPGGRGKLTLSIQPDAVAACLSHARRGAAKIGRLGLLELYTVVINTYQRPALLEDAIRHWSNAHESNRSASCTAPPTRRSRMARPMTRPGLRPSTTGSSQTV